MTGLEAAPGLAAWSLAAMAAMTFAAAAVRGLTGFGMAIVLVPLLGMVVRPEEAVVLGILLQLLIGPVGLGTIVADSERPSSLVIAGCAMLSTPLGLWLLARTSPDVARILIATVAVAAFALVIWPQKSERPPRIPLMVLTGLSAGVLTGFAAMPGPPVVPFYLRPGLSPIVARASMMLVFFATAVAGSVVSWLFGLASPKLVMLALILFIPMALGNWIGSRAFGKLEPFVWRVAVGVLLGVAGASAIWRAIN